MKLDTILVPKKQRTTKWRDCQSASHTQSWQFPLHKQKAHLPLPPQHSGQGGPASARFPPCMSADATGIPKSWRIWGHQFPDTYLVHKVGFFSHFLGSTCGYWCVSLRPIPMILLILKRSKSRQQCLCIQKKPPGFLHSCRAGRAPPPAHFLPGAGLSLLSDCCLVAERDGFWQGREELFYFHGNVNSHSAGISAAT